jgi:hypothetical protein
MHARGVRGLSLKWQEWLRDESAMSVTNISCRTLVDRELPGDAWIESSISSAEES